MPALPPSTSATVAPAPPSRDPAERRRARRGHSAEPVEAQPHIYRQSPPSSVHELQRQAHQIIRQLDAVQCDVHLTPYPVSNGVRQERRPPGAGTTGSLDRLALRQIKNSKNDVKFRSTNALPTFGQRTKVADAAKNNIIKAESLKREGVDRIAAKKADGYLKHSATGSHQHLNNINLLQHQQQSHSIAHRHGSGISCADEDLPDDCIISKALPHAYGSTQPPSQPMKHHSLERSTPTKVVNSSSQTPPGFTVESDVIYTQLMHQPRPNVGPKPSSERRGFSYLNGDDVELMEHAQTVQDRSRYIIQKIARERSRSPAHKAGWTSQKVSSSISPPPPVLPRSASPGGQVQRSRYGSSIVLIGTDPAQEGDRPARAPAPVPPSAAASRQQQSQQLYSVPRSYTDNVIRLSVSGSHSSSAGEASPSGPRRRSISHQPSNSPPAQSGLRSKSSSPDRYFYGVNGHDNDHQERYQRPNVVPPPRYRKAPPIPKEAPFQRRLPVTPQQQRASSAPRRDAVTADRGRDEHERGRSVDPSPAPPPRARHDSPDKKKKIKIKFIYDDTRDEPSDVRLAKYTEYRGSDEARSASPPSDAPLPHSVVQIDIEDGAQLRHEKARGRQREQFLAHFLAGDRPSSEERREGCRVSPDQQSFEKDRVSYDKDLHGVWSSLDEEDQVTARQQSAESSTNNLNNGLHSKPKGQRPPDSSDEGRQRRSARPARQSSVSPDRVEQVKKKSWLSSTLSRLDFKSRRHADTRAKQQAAAEQSRPVARTASHSDRRPATRRVVAPDSRHRSGSGGSRSGSREPAPRRPPGRTPSLSQRYNSADSDASAGVLAGAARRPRSLSSSVASSQPERAAGSGGAAASGGSGSSRSVFLHATTVADIPPPDPSASPAPPPPRERRKVGRSFSLVAPFRPKRREKEIVYENQTGGEANGRPPRPPPPARRGSKDSLLERRPARSRAPVVRSVSMPKDTRPAGFLGRRPVAAR